MICRTRGTVPQTKLNPTNKMSEQTTPARRGRPATFPEDWNIVPVTTKTSEQAMEMLRELATERQSPFGLKHNSIGAELHRCVENAYKRLVRDRERRAAKNDGDQENA